ncbi:hypothetical protein [Arthrobacter sp. Br18]|nr:hypothetical protein [Arthrobacter sp. Br18]
MIRLFGLIRLIRLFGPTGLIRLTRRTRDEHAACRNDGNQHPELRDG